MLETVGFLLLVIATVVWWRYRFGVGDAVRTVRGVRYRVRRH